MSVSRAAVRLGILLMVCGGVAAAQGTAYAFVEGAATGSVNATYSFNPSGQPVTGGRTGLGQYSLTFAGTNLDSGWGVLATSFLAKGYCNVTGWNGSVVTVLCFGPSGFPSDSEFMVLAVQTHNDKGIGFAWGSNPTGASYNPISAYSYNPSGGAITLTRSGVGTYNANFAGMNGSGGSVQVTAFGSANANCYVTGWASSGGGFSANLQCQNGAGNPVDAGYVIAVMPAASSPPGIGWVWANQPNTAQYTPAAIYTYNPGGAVTITRSGTGTYKVSLAGLNASGGLGGTALVSGFGGGGLCQAQSWSYVTGGQVDVNISCNDGSGTAVNANFTLLFIPGQPKVVIDTSPSGKQILVDNGIQVTAPQTYQWVPGTPHTIALPSPQAGATGVQYTFANWSDGGAPTHTVTAPSTAGGWIGNLNTEYYLTIQAGTGGTTNQTSGWRTAGTQVSISASPNVGMWFVNWTGSGAGSYWGPSPTRTITMNGPIMEMANFAALPPNGARVVCGSATNYVDSQGVIWWADYGYSGTTGTYAVGADIRNTVDPGLYQHERFASQGNLQYQFPLVNGNYLVRLKFAEIYFYRSGQRKFDVQINGTTMQAGLDIFSWAQGSNTAVDRVYPAIVSNNTLTVTLAPVVSAAKVSAIEIIPAGPGPVTVNPSVARVIGTPGQQQFNANRPVNWSISPNVGSIDSNGLYTRPAAGSFTLGQQVTVTATSQADATQTATAVMTLGGDLVETDIGAVPVAGGSGPSPGDSARSLYGSGDINGTADAFRYSYETISGDGAITARYNSPSSCCVNPTKAGVMVRATAAPDSPHAFMAIYSGIVGLFESRGTSGGPTSTTFGGAGSMWVKLTRKGNLFSGYISAEGVSWIPVGSATIVMSPTVTVGFAVSSGFGPLHNAVFDNIRIDSSPVTISVDQTLVSLAAGQAMQFTASTLGTSNTGVTWSIRPANLGAINSTTGAYTAPASVFLQETVTVTATSNADATKTSTMTAFIGAFVPVRVNAGGPTHIDPLGVFWNADTGSTGGNVFSAGNPIAGTQTPYLYQTERFSASGPLVYNYVVPNGSYLVKLKFAEIFFTQTGQRKFHVSINGTQVLTNFDIVQVAGGPNTAIDTTFPVVVTNGGINITFTPVTSAPKVGAIEITPN